LHPRFKFSARFQRFWTVFFEDAKEYARKLDAEFAETGILKGPLHGVPISVKDQCAFLFSSLSLEVTFTGTTVNVKGYDSTIGYTQWANKPAESDAAVRLPHHPPTTKVTKLQLFFFLFTIVSPLKSDRRDATRSGRDHHRQDEHSADPARL
jgi:hypothetical protein